MLKINKLSSHEKAWRKPNCLLLRERSQSEIYILYDSNYMTFWKRQNCGDTEKKSVVTRGWGGVEG